MRSSLDNGGEHRARASVQRGVQPDRLPAGVPGARGLGADRAVGLAVARDGRARVELSAGKEHPGAVGGPHRLRAVVPRSATSLKVNGPVAVGDTAWITCTQGRKARRADCQERCSHYTSGSRFPCGHTAVSSAWRHACGSLPRSQPRGVAPYLAVLGPSRQIAAANKRRAPDMIATVVRLKDAPTPRLL